MKIGSDWDGERDALLAALRAFAPVMARAPFRNEYGLRGVSAFALFWFLRRLQPDIVFEVGVWRGFGTWLIEQAVPEAELHCLDPMVMLQGFMSRWKVGRIYRSPRAAYSGDDFSCAPIAERVRGRLRPLAVFDDHQNKLPRLRQCREAGIRDIVFDDNMVAPGTHRSLEDERLDPAGREELEREIESYEIFPALWPVDARIGGLTVREEGLDFPIEPAFRAIHAERDWHSSVTYVRLRPEPLA
ncbi:MAG TPA: hypothetical protein VFW19_14300 [Allosphingosinicella sp.]|nr:hypothetical protein [Allosphingosinicella sp.]